MVKIDRSINIFLVAPPALASTLGPLAGQPGGTSYYAPASGYPAYGAYGYPASYGSGGGSGYSYGDPSMAYGSPASFSLPMGTPFAASLPGGFDFTSNNAFAGAYSPVSYGGGSGSLFGDPFAGGGFGGAGAFGGLGGYGGAGAFAGVGGLGGFDPAGMMFPPPGGGFAPPTGPSFPNMPEFQQAFKFIMLFLVLNTFELNGLFPPDGSTDPGTQPQPQPNPNPPDDDDPEPTVNREDLLTRIIDNYDQLKVLGIDDKDSTFGIEDLRPVLQNPDDYDAELVQLVRDIYDNRDLIDLADWILDTSGDETQDRTAKKFQFIGALEVLRDKDEVNDAVSYLMDNFGRIARNGGNSTAMERSDIEAEIETLENGTEEEQAIADTLKRAYFQPGSGDRNDFITVLANASGNNSPDDQVITIQGLFNIKRIINRRPEDGAIGTEYDYHNPDGNGGAWGDPHGYSLRDGTRFEFQPASGSTVNLLEDRGIRINGKLDQWGNGQYTVFSDIYMLFNGNKVTLSRGDDAAPVIEMNDGTTVTLEEGQSITLDDGTILTWEGGNLSFDATEYDGTISMVNHGEGYINVDFVVDSEIGNRSDGVWSQGIIGNTSNYDVPANIADYNMFTGEGLLEGDLTFDDYTVDGDPFGGARNTDLHRYDR